MKLVLRQLLADQNRLAAKERLERLLHEAASSSAAGSCATPSAPCAATRRARYCAPGARRGIGSLADLADFYWKASLYHDPDAGPRVAAARVQIAAWGEMVRGGIAPNAPDLERAEALRLVLAEEGGLRGNAERYYDPANSFLDRVVASRRGIPLSLSVLYMLVGEAAGIAVLPVGMPGHFLARVGARFIDPFHDGLTVGRRRCGSCWNGAARRRTRRPGALRCPGTWWPAAWR